MKALKTAGGKAPCFKWNDGECKAGNECKFAHVCSRKLANNGMACGGSHKASKHDNARDGEAAKN